MSVCPRCGNHIQPYAHGVCRTCERIAGEHRRYGRRRPATRRHRPVKPSGPPPANKTCSLCGKGVRADRMAGHLWNAHGLRPYASKEEWKQARQESGRQSTPYETRQPGEERKKCPICGFPVPVEQFAAHQRRHQLAGKGASKPNPAAVQAPPPRPDRPPRQQTVVVSSPSAALRHHPVNDINRLLEAIFGRPTRLSELLVGAGLSQNDVTRLRRDHLDVYLVWLMGHWVGWWQAILSPTDLAILRKHYDRVIGPSAANTKALVPLTVDQRRQALTAALDQLRLDANKRKLVEIAVEEAREILELT